MVSRLMPDVYGLSNTAATCSEDNRIMINTFEHLGEPFPRLLYYFVEQGMTRPIFDRLWLSTLERAKLVVERNQLLM